MPDLSESHASAPKSLRLFRKRHAAWVIVCSLLAVVGPIADAAYQIYSATLPPNLL